jgi:hypothetical protein
MQLSTVTIQIPTLGLPDLYRFASGLFALSTAEESSIAPKSFGLVDSQTGELTDWEDGDTDNARKLYERMTSTARQVYDLLIESADDGYTVEELAVRTKMSRRQVAGALSWPAKYAKDCGKVPIHLQQSDGKVYVTGKVARLFQSFVGKLPTISVVNVVREI